VDVNSDLVLTAFELSDKWVELEEKQASTLMDTTSGCEVDQKEKDRKTSYKGSRIKTHIRSVHGIRSPHRGVQRSLPGDPAVRSGGNQHTRGTGTVRCLRLERGVQRVGMGMMEVQERIRQEGCHPQTNGALWQRDRVQGVGSGGGSWIFISREPASVH
jgi:hypothetical protein